MSLLFTSCPSSPPRIRHGRCVVAVVVALTAVLSGPAASAQDAPGAMPVARSVLRVFTLQQVLDSAVAHYPALDAARARVRAARGTRTTAGALGNPVLAYQVDNTAFPGGASPAGMEREAMTTATLPLAPFYQRGVRVRQADAVVRAAEADARSARQRVALDAARAYYRVAVAQVGADAAQNLTQWLDSVVAYNRTRVGQGVTAEADLIRSQLERDRAVADAGMNAADLARARADLSAFLGDPEVVGTDFVIALDDAPLAGPATLVFARADVARPTDGPPSPRAIGVAMSTAVDRRPDVRAARERLTAAGAGAALEQRMIIRELGATLGVKRSGGTNSLIAGVSLPLPVFDQNRGERARAQGERDAAAFDVATQERAARADVLGAREAARILTERAAVLTRRESAGRGPAYLTRADEARAIALGAYREGAVSLLQVLDAARAWGEARVAYYRTLYAQHEAVLALLVAEGDDLATTLPRVGSASSAARTLPTVPPSLGAPLR